MSPNPPPKEDWSATQYLKFHAQRTRPVYDLLSQIPPSSTWPGTRGFDLGCGPGNSTTAILDTFPDVKITGIDSSKDMLEKARGAVSGVEFVEGDLSAWEVPKGKDQDGEVGLLFSNAVFHWLRSSQRIPTIARLFERLKKGAVLAFQVPDNYNERTHRLMRETALLPDTTWSSCFSETKIGDVSDGTRPDLDPIESPTEFYNALSPLSSDVNIWRTMYHHVLPGPHDIVEWVKGTGLQPFLHMIGDEEVRGQFLKEYERRVGEEYAGLTDGKVLLGYPRLFVVAVRR